MATIARTGRGTTAGMLAVAMALTAPQAAQADAGAFIGGLVGGALGSAIGNAATRERAQPRERVIVRERAVTRPQVDSFTRQQNRSVQVALNYFGFPAGSPDGILGRRSRGAISSYQAHMGFPATGYLAGHEMDFLLTSHARAQANAFQAQQLAAQYGGQAGILIAYRQAAAGAPIVNAQPVIVTAPTVALPANPPVVVQQQPQVVVQQPQPQPQPQTPTVVINNTTQAPAPQQAPAPEVREAAAQPAPAAAPAAPASQTQEAAAPPTGMMPSFIGTTVEASMASFCNTTSLVTNTNGGMLTAASLSDPAVDPNMALGEQFCLARTYAIADGEKLTATVQGVTLADMQTQCAAFAPSMRDYVASVVAKAPADSTSDLQTFVISSGMNPMQLAANARICLSIGYRSDQADVALASALVLVGLGEAAYGEVLAHHLANGFGAPRRLDRAADWYDTTVAALQGGATPVVAPGAADRTALLHAAAVKLRGGGRAPTAAPAPQAATAAPMFAMPTAPAQKVSN